MRKVRAQHYQMRRASDKEKQEPPRPEVTRGAYDKEKQEPSRSMATTDTAIGFLSLRSPGCHEHSSSLAAGPDATVSRRTRARTSDYRDAQAADEMRPGAELLQGREPRPDSRAPLRA